MTRPTKGVTSLFRSQETVVMDPPADPTKVTTDLLATDTPGSLNPLSLTTAT